MELNPEHIDIMAIVATIQNTIRSLVLGASTSGSLKTHSIVQSFPSDLLFEIFMWGLPTALTSRPRGAFTLVVSQVCRSWRETALAHPSLWASTSITSSPHDSDGSVSMVNYIRLWKLYFERSGESFLDVEVDSNVKRCDEFRGIMDDVLAHQHRLWSLDISCNTDQIPLDSDWAVLCAPRLKSIDFTVNPAGDVPDDAGGKIVVDLAGCPSLETIDVFGWCYFYREVGKLTSLRRAMLDVNEFSQADKNINVQLISSLLQAAPNLEELRTVLYEGAILPQSPKLLLLAHLRDLDLSVGHGGVYVPDSLLRNLDLPMLDNLHLFIHVNGHPNGTWSELNGLKNLRRLSLSYVLNVGPSGPDEIPSLLRSMPSLKRLILFGERVSNHTMQALTLRGQGRDLCPLLEAICICSDVYDRRRNTHHIDAINLVNMVSSRWLSNSAEYNSSTALDSPAKGTLKRIAVCLPGMLDVRLSSPIKTFVEQGLKFKMVSGQQAQDLHSEYF
ncbi:hypothetical protein SCHPADRAFT_235078 [Schizopora paradoxa]|uniref:Uncharacterized protein n=1 Tax=Schizopora paradoxa TaxID=27342 RepID=A0A0H2RVU5_9AGAM|nr:hypothetical protein SCHPADRAFT_235078 [Schizopora paradoxa]